MDLKNLFLFIGEIISYSMLLAETHIINASSELDLLTRRCKDLYNKANYIIRQEFIAESKYTSKYDMFDICKEWDEYKAMPVRVSRGVLRTLDANWKGFFAAMKSWKQDKGKFLGKPNLPKYLDKKGKFLALFFDNAILRPKKGKTNIGFSSLSMRLNTQIPFESIVEVQIVPTKTDKYKVKVIYDFKEETKKEDNNVYASIDLGVNNLMTITSNKVGFIPIKVNGGPLKSMNQFFNKKKAKMQSLLPNGVKTSKAIQKLCFKRDMKINDFLQKASKLVVEMCVREGINTLVVGNAKSWKQEVNMGKRNNQSFVSIPFDRLVQMLKCKCIKRGINFVQQNEAYTSKCSFLDGEAIQKHETYIGKRIQRGMFQAHDGRLINADVNGSLNILRKAFPKAFANGIEGVAVHPKQLNVA